MARILRPRTVACLVFGWALAIATLAAGADDSPAWFDTVAGAPPGDEELAVLTTHCARKWLTETPGPQTVPPALAADSAPRIVLVSVSNGEAAPYVGVGAARGLIEACGAALRDLELPMGFQVRWIRVDVAFDAAAIGGQALSAALPLELGRDGLAFGRESGLALGPEELVSQALLASDGVLDLAQLERWASRRRRSTRPAANETLDLYRFRTVYGFTGPGLDVEVRGMSTPPAPGPDDLRAAAQAAGDYLVRAVQADGRFDYIYPESRDDRNEDTSIAPSAPYNILRHAGTVYAMLELFEASGDPTLLAASERALDYLVAQVAACKLALAEHRCVVERGRVKLGGNALAVVALAKHAQLTGDRRHLQVMLDLTDWIRAVQTERGRFAIHLQTWPGAAVLAFASDYYSGQAILALVHLYRLTGEEALLDAAAAASRHLIEASPASALSGKTVNHWELIALDHLHRLRPDPAWKARVRDLATLVLASQQREGPPAEAIGGFDDPPRSDPTRLEALAAASQVLHDTEGADALLDGLALGVAYQLAQQYTPSRALYLDEPQRALGGFRAEPSRRAIRIDTVQHNLSAILALDRLRRSPPRTSTADPPTRSHP